MMAVFGEGEGSPRGEGTPFFRQKRGFPPPSVPFTSAPNSSNGVGTSVSGGE